MKVIAHRGLSAHYLENTLEAFKKAIEEGVDAIEFDVHQVENKLAIFHDYDLSRLSNLNQRLSEMTCAELNSVTLNNGDKIPFLDQVLELVKGQVPLNLELKAVCDPHLIIDLLTSYVYQFDAELVISSFDHPLLIKIMALLRETRISNNIKIGALVAHTPINHAQYAIEMQADIAAIDAYLVTPEFVKHSHNHNLEVWCYTVNDVDLLAKLKNMDVDGVFTNDPKLIKDFLAQV